MSDGSIIGRSTTVRGHVRGTGPIRVEGSVEGDVTTDGDIDVGPEARIRGDVSGATLRVGGAVAGDLTGTEAVLLIAGARVVGNLSAPRIGVAEGALVRGNIETGPGEGQRVVTSPVAERRLPVAPPAAKAPITPVRAAVPPVRRAPVRPPAPKTVAKPVETPSPRAVVPAAPASRSATRAPTPVEPTRAKPARVAKPAPAPVVPAITKGIRGRKKRAGQR